MAVAWCDDFTGYGTTAAYMANGAYASIGGAQLAEDPDTILTGNVLYLNNLFDDVRKVIPTPNATVGQAFRLWMSALPSSSNIPAFVRFNDGTNVCHVSLAVTSTGVIQAWRGTIQGGSQALLGSTTGPVLVSNAWQHIECKVLISDTVGTVEVRVGGITVLNLTGQDTGNSASLTVAQVVLADNNGFTGTALIPMYFKDYVVWDGSGAANNNFFGSVTVSSLIPDGDDTNTWTRSSGSTAYTLIDELDPNDTDYLSDGATPAAKQVNTLSNLPSNVSAVKALMVYTRAANSDGGTGTMKTGLVSGATSGLGADKTITSAFTYYNDFFETDPNTSAAWTVANVNAAKISFTRTS